MYDPASMSDIHLFRFLQLQSPLCVQDWFLQFAPPFQGQASQDERADWIQRTWIDQLIDREIVSELISDWVRRSKVQSEELSFWWCILEQLWLDDSPLYKCSRCSCNPIYLEQCELIEVSALRWYWSRFRSDLRFSSLLFRIQLGNLHWISWTWWSLIDLLVFFQAEYESWSLRF